MKVTEFEERIKKQEVPLLVDISATWCAPCRTMEGVLKKVEKDYVGWVEILKIDADESPELLRSLGIMGVPTLLGYANGQRMFRHTGAQSTSALRDLFEVLLGNKVLQSGPGLLDRFLRIGGGLIIMILAWYMPNHNYLIMGLGGLVLFWGVHDRCPIWRALTAKFKNDPN